MPNNDFPNGAGKHSNNEDDYFKKWYTIKQVMKFLNIGKTTFYNYEKKYGLRISGRGHSRRVHQDDLDDFMRGRGK